jgi:hypothetical protein
LEAYNRSFSLSQTFGSGAGRSGPPQGVSAEQFEAAAEIVRNAGAKYGDDIVVQGSRAAGTARANSDIDFAIRVSPERFEQILKERFKVPNPGSANERTMLRAIETGKIQTGELGLRGPRNEVQRLLGLEKVDLSVVKARGAFDQGPFIDL